jgi:cytochrome c-type biogenesis protein CcmE
LVVALGTAVLLAVALIYTSFSASSEARQPSDLMNAPSGGSYDVTGEVVPGSIEHHGSRLDFQIADRDDPSAKIPVTYSGTIPDPFQDGREVIVSGTLRDGTFVGNRDSLITKCPSKFQDQANADPEHVIIDDGS